MRDTVARIHRECAEHTETEASLLRQLLACMERVTALRQSIGSLLSLPSRGVLSDDAATREAVLSATPAGVALAAAGAACDADLKLVGAFTRPTIAQSTLDGAVEAVGAC